jgi:spore germination protein GerM
MKRVVIAAIVVIAAASACRRGGETPASTNPNVANRVAARTVKLFYESPQMLLAAEPRSVALPENAAAAIPIVVRELLKGPSNPPLLRLLPPDTALRGAFLLPGGTVVVDLGGPTVAAGWATGSHQELMAIHSIVQTLVANFPEAARVRLVVNGSSSETLGGHLSLRHSFVPLPALVDPQQR